jgi:hypothetical protein
MNKKFVLAVAMLTTVSLFVDVRQAQAKCRRHHRHHASTCDQTTQSFACPTNAASLYTSSRPRTQIYSIIPAYSTNYGNYNAYGNPSQRRYSIGSDYPNAYRNRSGSLYRSNTAYYGYPSRSGLSIGIGMGGYGMGGYGNRGYNNRGYGGYRGLGF